MSSEAEKSKKKKLLYIGGAVVLVAIFVALMVTFVGKGGDDLATSPQTSPQTSPGTSPETSPGTSPETSPQATIPLGSACNEDDDCGTNEACCPTSDGGSEGICMECCGNRDCTARIDPIDFPPPGEFHKPFCIDNTCQAYQNKQFSQIPPEGYPVYFASETYDNAKSNFQEFIPRNVQEEGGPIHSQVTYIDFDDQDATSFNKEEVIYNGTHITIPTYQSLHAGYSKSFHHYDYHETGIVSFLFAENTFSVVTDYPAAAAVEKYHALTYDGIMDTSRGDYVAQKSAEQFSADPTFNAASYYARAIPGFQTQRETQSGFRTVEAGVDRAHLWQIRRFVNEFPEESFGSVNPGVPSWANHTSKAKKAIEYARDPTFERDLKTSTEECKHLEQIDGISYTRTSITFPLGRPITSVAGIMHLSPMYYVDFGVGMTTLHYDESENVLQIYREDYQYTRENADIMFPGPYPSGMWLSPVSSGPEYYVDPDVDGRGDFAVSMEIPEDDKSVISFLNPEADFTFWAHNRSVVCDPEAEGDSFWEHIDFARSPKANDIYGEVWRNANILQGIVRGMPCGNIFMRTDYGRTAHGNGVLELNLWVHLIGEVREDKTKEVGTAKFFDEWECFYQDKDLALCSED